MNRRQVFEIDLDERFPILRHAPIVEAVIQFVAPPIRNFDLRELKPKLEERFRDYSLTDQFQFEAGVSGSPGGLEVRHNSKFDAVRLTSSDEKFVCRWKRSSLAVTRLAPYEDWDRFRATFLPFWAAYLELNLPEVLESLSVRYISRIALKANEKLSDFVQKAPPPLKGLGLSSDSFFHQDTIPVQGHPFEVRLIRAMQRAAESTAGKPTLIVDIDVATTEATVFEELDARLKTLRFLKNKVFFAYMKDVEKKFK